MQGAICEQTFRVDVLLRRREGTRKGEKVGVVKVKIPFYYQYERSITNLLEEDWKIKCRDTKLRSILYFICKEFMNIV